MTALEAAMAVCVADPDTRPVHRLRTESRRVEALLLLLALVPGMPEHRKPAATLLRTLRKLRRAAGDVRDLDVHRKMLEVFAEAESAEAQAAGAEKPTKTGGGEISDQGEPAKPRRLAAAASVDPEAEASSSAAATLSRSAEDLRKRMGRERQKAADALQATLKAQQKKVARAAEALLKVLRPAQELPLPGPELLQDAESVLARDGLLGEDVGKLSRVELHTVRKAAKAARYVAESLPGDGVVAEAARRFEALQEAGGQWHDAWQLARAARRRFGKGHELTAVYRGERDRRLASYREALLTTGAGRGARARAPKTSRPPRPASTSGPKRSVAQPMPVSRAKTTHTGAAA